MGANDFHTCFVGRTRQQKKDGTHNLDDISGVTGIDGSMIIYNGLKTDLGSAVFDIEPRVPLFSAFQKVMRDIKSICCNGREVIMFLDGREHPVKRAGKNRNGRQEAIEELRVEYSLETLANYERVKSLRKQCVYRRDDLTVMIINECRRLDIKVFCAPFEADWQLVAAQRAGIINNIISNDSDIFVIGGDNIMTAVNFYTGTCCLYKRSEVLQRPTMKGVSNDLQALSTILGNDYIERLEGNGPKKSAELTKTFISKNETQRKQMIDDLAATRVWNRGDTVKATDFAEKFWNSYYLLQYPPVFNLIQIDNDVDIDMNNPSTFDVILAPLRALPHGITNEEWGKMIGFGKDTTPQSLLKGDAKDLFLNNIAPDTGHPPEPLPQPLFKCQPGKETYEVAHGAYLDERIPVHCQADWALETFLTQRNIRPRGAYNRKKIMQVVKKTLELTERIGDRAPQPREFTPSNNTVYDADEPLEVREDMGGTLLWTSDWTELMNTLEFIEPLNDDDFFEIFEEGRNGIQVRSKKIIASGSFNVDEVQIAHCRIKSNQHNAIAIRMRCVPSMKSEPYWVTFVCDLETKKLVAAPTSRCGCPAGLGGCSHLRALYGALCEIQDMNDELGPGQQLTQQEALELFPPAMATMKKIPIPWSFVFKDDDADRALKKEKKMMEHQNRCTAAIQRLNNGHGFDDEDDDDGDSWSPSDDESISSEFNDDEFDEEFDDDEVFAADYDEEDLYDADEFVETIAPLDTHSKERNIKLCEFVHEEIGRGKKRAAMSNDARKSDYKYERSKISDHLKSLLNGKTGPNESTFSKLRQLQRLQRLDDMFNNGREQWEKCLLSHYLEHTRNQRKVLIAQLEHAIRIEKGKADLNWVPERLAKLPPGYDGLGDRGFEGTSTSYPHLNEMKTPFFLDGRDQFSHAEIYGSRDLCQGRYGSEVFNKRTNDFFYLHDKIPRSNFLYLEEVLKWSMFHANLCQPFLIPRGANDYFPSDTAHLQRPAKKMRAQKSILSQPTTATVDGDGVLPISASDNPAPMNYIEVAMPERYYAIGLDKVGLLMDGKDCVTDTVRVNSFLSRSQYSDKMHSSAARYIMWVLPCGLSVTYTPLFLGRASEKALVEYWGGSTYDLQ